MRKVTARCDEEQGCPLYHRGDAIEFIAPAVQGVTSAPICARAVGTFESAVSAIRTGDNPLNHQHAYCGGCELGKAWFHFSVEDAMTSFRVAPQFASFALHALSKTSIFAGTHPALLERVLPLFRERRVLDGETVITKNEPGKALYIIVTGQFAVIQPDDHAVEHHIAFLGPGDCFGEMSLITGEGASATVRAKVGSVLLEVPKDDFPKLLSMVPPLALTLARILANRLARAGHVLIDEIKRGLIGRLDLISPVELIQAMNVNNQNGVLTVQGDGSNATIFFVDGQVADVQLGTLRGEEGLYAFLTWSRGTFRFQPGPKEVERTILGDTVGLLLEGVRRIDEAKETQRREPTANA